MSCLEELIVFLRPPLRTCQFRGQVGSSHARLAFSGGSDALFIARFDAHQELEKPREVTRQQGKESDQLGENKV
jgi:hypothetical protein